MELAGIGRRPRVRTAALAVLAVVGLAYLLYAALKPTAPHADFNYYWLAGKMWGQGLDPYGPLFPIEGHKLGEVTFPAVYWAYTPNWWPISLIVSRIPLGVATYIWMTLTLIAALGACELLRRTRGAVGLSSGRDQFLMLFCFLGLSSFASTTMMWGNVALFIMAGACLLAYGLATRRDLWIAVGLTVMLLKPHIGLAALAAVAVASGGWRPALWAAVASTLMALPALLSSAPESIVHGLGQVDRFYEGYEVNSPPSQTGLAHFVYLFSGRTLGGTSMVAVAMVSAALLSLLGRRSAGADSTAGRTIVVLFAGLVSAAMFLRLHVYDLAMLLPVIALASGAGITVMLLVGAGALLFFRPENLATVLQALGSPTFLPGTLPTIGLVAIYLAALLVCAGVSEVGRDKRDDASPAVPA